MLSEGSVDCSGGRAIKLTRNQLKKKIEKLLVEIEGLQLIIFFFIINVLLQFQMHMRRAEKR